MEWSRWDHSGSDWVEFKITEDRVRTLQIEMGPEGVRGGQRGVGELTTISPGAGTLQMGPEWVILGGV